MDDYPLSKQEFDSIYHKVPRLTVELIIQSDKGVLLTLRSIEPCAGLWHIPGGTVYYGESFKDAVRRIANKELGINVLQSEMIGYIEYPEHVKSGYGDPRGIAFKITDYSGDFETNNEADKFEWFIEFPDNMHPHQGEFLIENQLLKGS